VVAVSERSVALTTTYEYLVDGRLSDQAREAFGVVSRHRWLRVGYDLVERHDM
jgi:hypothetical protein